MIFRGLNSESNDELGQKCHLWTDTNSLMNKKWFAKDNQGKNLIWPFEKINGHQIPFWVKKKDYARWIEMSELDRCAYYYIRMNEYLERVPNKIEIKYDDFVNDPMPIVNYLIEKLPLRGGTKTKSIIESIKATDKKRDVNIYSKISSDLIDSVKYFSSLL